MLQVSNKRTAEVATM